MQDLLRFFLALSVILFHYKHFAIQSWSRNQIPDDYTPPYQEALSIFYTHGYHAVAVFFFLSGYMLALRISDQTVPRFSYRNFLVQRLARIYPAHALTLISMGLLAVMVQQYSLQPFMTYNDNFLNFVASLFLLNGIGIMRDTSFNLPSWSLSVEMVCYLLFGAVCVLSFAKKANLWFLGVVIGIGINEVSTNPNVSNVGSGMVFFFSGAITGVRFIPWRSWMHSNAQGATITLLTLFALSFTMSLHASLGVQKLIWICISLPALVIAITIMDERLIGGGKRPFIWFGLMSFSIYIWHFPVQAILHYLFSSHKIDGIAPYNTLLLFWFYLAASVLVGHISLSTIEKWGGAAIKCLKTR